MDPFFSLLMLCAAMFLGSMGAGLVPVKCALSEARIRVLTIFGAGLLVGTALIVIIPEGVHMWYEAEAQAAAAATAAAHAAAEAAATVVAAGSDADSSAVHAGHRHLVESMPALGTAVATAVASAIAGVPDVVGTSANTLQRVEGVDTLTTESDSAVVVENIVSDSNGGSKRRRMGALRGTHTAMGSGVHDHDHGHDDHAHTDHEHQAHGSHRAIGASLACGFAFMLIVDTMGGGHGHGHSHGGGGNGRRHGHSHGQEDDGCDAGDGEGGGHGHSHGASGGVDGDHAPVPSGSPPPPPPGDVEDEVDERSRSAAMGLLVHAAVDGIALGAAAAAQQSSVELLVFVAIMLHKAPAAFGLASYLIHNGVPMEEVKNQLVKFSSAAPCTALVTFYVLRLGIVGASLRMLAVCFMFSGGTFLFVSAAHILPEIQASADEGAATPAQRRKRFANMWVMVCGLMLPILINLEHGH